MGINSDYTSHSCLLSIIRGGAVGDTTTTDPRSQRNRASRRGGHLLTRARSSTCKVGLPALRAPGASVSDGRTIRRDHETAAGHQHQESHTGYQLRGEHDRYHSPRHPQRQTLAGFRYGLAMGRGRHDRGQQGLPTIEDAQTTIGTTSGSSSSPQSHDDQTSCPRHEGYVTFIPPTSART